MGQLMEPDQYPVSPSTKPIPIISVGFDSDSFGLAQSLAIVDLFESVERRPLWMISKEPKPRLMVFELYVEDPGDEAAVQLADVPSTNFIMDRVGVQELER